MSKPTIVRIIARLNVGGPSIQAILMTDDLRARGYRTLLLAGDVPKTEQSMEYLAKRKGIEVTRIDTMSRQISVLRDLRAFFRILRILRREKPSVVHTHTAKAGVLGRIAAIAAGVPVRVHTFHGHVFDGYFSPLLTRLFIAIERILARHTDYIIAVSERQRWELAHRFRIAPQEKIVNVPLGFELDRFLEAGADGSSIRTEIAAGEASPIIGWAGRLASIKAPELFVECAAMLHSRLPAARFVMVGDGDLSCAIHDQIEARGLNEVFHRIRFQEDMAAIYRAVDLLLLTSRNEGTPVVLLEAMASGKAFVATEVGGVADLMVGDPRVMNGFRVYGNGILADQTAAAIAGATAYLLERPGLRHEMGEQGRQFVAKRYSHVRLADDLEQLYRSLILSKKAQRTPIPASSDAVPTDEIA